MRNIGAVKILYHPRDPDIAEVFNTSEAVHHILHALLSAIAKTANLKSDIA